MLGVGMTRVQRESGKDGNRSREWLVRKEENKKKRRVKGRVVEVSRAMAKREHDESNSEEENSQKVGKEKQSGGTDGQRRRKKKKRVEKMVRGMIPEIYKKQRRRCARAVKRRKQVVKRMRALQN